MTRISSAAYVVAGKTLLGQARNQTIPYVANGMSLAGMDCQGLAEYLLIQCGVPKAECNLAGSNAHWRNCVWTGTPEQCKAAFGAVPPGAWVFIVSDNDGGAPEKYRGDGLGDAGHMGVYLGGCAIHASSSRGYVAESKFEGKTIKNGGWNMIGLPPWVDYGGHVNAVLATLNDTPEAGEPDNADTPGNVNALPSGPVVPDVSKYYKVKRGCLGNAVRRLQTWLMDLGYDVGASGVDGDFGRATETAVLAFQQKYGLDADGIVGRKTWAALAEARCFAMRG